jgi:polyhydroxybutyrate depolymerase
VACNPSRPVAVLEIHGTADPIVPFDGGTMRGRGGASDIASAPAMVDRWRAADGCPDPATDTLPDTGDGTVVHRFASAPCGAGTAVTFYRVDDGGHTWPGGTAISAQGGRRIRQARIRRVGSYRAVFRPARAPTQDATAGTVNSRQTAAELVKPARPA